MIRSLNITEVSKLTGLDVFLLKRMRSRESITLNSGPPFCKIIDALGNTKYVYKKSDVLKWMKRRRFRVTAGDAATILNISRDELLARFNQGQHSWEGKSGKLVINTGKNIFIWIPKLALEYYKPKKAIP